MLLLQNKCRLHIRNKILNFGTTQNALVFQSVPHNHEDRERFGTREQGLLMS